MSSTESTVSTNQMPEQKETPNPHPPSNYADAEKNYQPKSPKFWAIIIGMYLSIFLVALDRMIVAVAIPAITNDFNSIADIGWYGSAYMLTAACFNPLFGRIYQMYSTKWAFLSSMLVFEVGSVLCGAAPSSVAFILGRAIAGAGSAGIFGGGMMIMIPLIPLRKKPTYTAIFGMAFGVSSVLGPLVGGSFTDGVSWRWCFYINLPIGGFTMLAMLLFLRVDSPKHTSLSLTQQLRRLDPVGVFFFVPSIVCLILALQWGGTTYAWSNPKIIGLLVTFGVLFAIFMAVEALTPETAMIPARVVLNRSIAGSMALMFLISGAIMSIVYYLAIWFQAVKGDSAMRAGIHTIPLVLAMVVFSIISAKVTERIGYYVPFMLLAPLLCATGAGMLSTLSPSSGHSAWIGYQVLFGFGLGSGFQQSNLAAQTVLPRADVPIGMALMFFMQQLGGAIFVAVSQNIFSTKLVQRLRGVSGLNAIEIIKTGATDIRKVVPVQELGVVMDAYNGAIVRVFLMAAIVSAVMILGPAAVEWRSIKSKTHVEKDAKSEKEAEKAQEEDA